MTSNSEHYDVVIIGSGPGGGTMAWRWRKPASGFCFSSAAATCPANARIGTAKAVFVDARYQAPETWYSSDGKSFHPGLHYFVGGNSKVYGAVLLRLRERDFEEIRHPDGDITGVAAEIRRVRALLPGRRRTLLRSRAARRRSDRAAIEKAVSLSAYHA